MTPRVRRVCLLVAPVPGAAEAEADVTVGAVPETFDGLARVDPVAADGDAMEDVCVTTIVAPEMTSVETMVVSEGAEDTATPEVAGLVVGGLAAEEAVGTVGVGSGVGEVVGRGSAAVEGGDVVGCELLEVGVCVGLGEGVAIVDEVVDVVATALVARAR